MGIQDKVTGRVKQAAGDLLGNDDLQRQGRNEERKADAKDELAREEERAEQAEARAENRAEQAEARAQQAAEREFEKADAEIEREQTRAEVREERADEKAQEVADLERRT